MIKLIDILDKNNIKYDLYKDYGISIFGDCLKIMDLLPENLIDLICSDNPYNIGIAKWDKIDNYIEWMGTIFKKWEKLLKDNGSLYWFHSDMNQIKDLMTWLENNTKFQFNSFINWYKENFRALSWKNPSDENNLRSWFNVCEFILMYTFQDSTGLQQIEAEFIAPRNPFAKELKKARLKKGVSINQVAEYGHFYGNVNHGGAVTNWEQGYNVPLKKQWKILCDNLPIERKEYEDLRKEYEDLRYTHNLDKNHNNVWFSQYKNNGDNHLCEKPDDIIDRIILCSSNKNNIVLDSFAGSFKIALRCINLERKFICIENNKKHYEDSQKLIKSEIMKYENKFYIPDSENNLFNL